MSPAAHFFVSLLLQHTTTYRYILQLHTLANTAVARRFCESSRHISRPCNLQPHQQRYVYIISKPNPLQFINISSFCTFSLLAAIHLFISSCDEIKISARWIKKLVAVTGGVQNLYCDIAYTRVFIHISYVGT